MGHELKASKMDVLLNLAFMSRRMSCPTPLLVDVDGGHVVLGPRTPVRYNLPLGV